MWPLKLLNWNAFKHFWEYFLFLYSCTEEFSCSCKLTFNILKSLWVCWHWGSSLSFDYLPAIWFVMWTFFCLSNNLQREYSKSIIYAARLTLNYAVLLPWKPLTTYYCLVWQINNASFSLMSPISKALVCQTKGLSVHCLVSNHGEWQMTRESCWNGPRIYQCCCKLKPS